MNKRGNISKKIFIKDKNGQVWVETVIYLLIAFVMIGLVLAFIKPKIEEMRDKAVTDQSLEMIKEIDNTIATIGSPGNKRILEINIKEGSLIIDSANDSIIFEMESQNVYSESGKTIQKGNIQVLTENNGRTNVVTLKRDFSDGYNLTYGGEEVLKTLNKAPNPYKLSITNTGDSSNKVMIDLNIE